MRILTVIFAFVLFALTVWAIAPNAALIPYVGVAYPFLPKAIVVITALLILTILADRPKIENTQTDDDDAVSLTATVPMANQADAEVVNFLAILQEKGRLVDFLMDDVAGYSDSQVGAAARVLHDGCKSALLEHFSIRQVRDENEGSKITVPTGYAPDDYRLVGRISGEAPFSGTLVHHGWKVEWVRLPRLLRTNDDRLPTIAPAEVELG